MTHAEPSPARASAPRLWAISDLHVRFRQTREFLARLAPHPDDWLIIAGDVGETVEHLEYALTLLGERFARLFWVPGNHELWTLPGESPRRVGEARYQHLVEVCRRAGVTTPEDEFALWDGPGGPCRIALLFTLYDYSFRPAEVQEADAVAWAQAAGILCVDEELLRPDPHPSRQAWCRARLASTEERLRVAAAEQPLILVNHFPLREEHVYIPAIPRFSIWCGTKSTEDWHRRFRAKVVVSGHLHVRSTRERDGVRFEEVSLGNPGQWDPTRRPEDYLRQILPAPSASAGAWAGLRSVARG